MDEERWKGNIAFLRYDKLVIYPADQDTRILQNHRNLQAEAADNQLDEHHLNHRRSTLHTVENREISLSFIILLYALLYTK